MYNVISDVQIPTSSVRIGGSGRTKYPFRELLVGDMFFVPDRAKNNLGTLASVTGKKLGRQFSTRLLYMADGFNSHKEVTADTEGAVLGIGVWRVA